jgi:hypothetical protein
MVTTLQMNVRDLLLRLCGTLILTFLTRVTKPLATYLPTGGLGYI